MTPKGKLILIPNLLNGDDIGVLSPKVIEAIAELTEFIVENEKIARRFLIKAGIPTAIDELTFHVLDKHNPRQDLMPFLMNALTGKNIGLISDAGCPAVADPGGKIVKMAHEMNILVDPLVGPSSILLALMASGMNGQQFTFHGYLPIEQGARSKEIKWLDKQIQQNGYTHIFIETPYRNQKLFEQLLRSCRGNTRLCLATDVTLKSQSVLTKTVGEWKRVKPDLHKRPTVFLLGK